MNGLEESRKAFSKASVILDVNRIIIMYNDKGLTVYQELLDDMMDTLRWLVKASRCFLVNVKKDKTVTMIFDIDTGLSEAEFFQPLERQVNMADIIAASEEMSQEPGEDFKEFMATEGANREIDAEFLRDLVLFISKKHPTFETVDGIRKWKRFYNECAGFIGMSRASDIRVMKYSADFDGCVELTYYNEDCPVKYAATDKGLLERALDVTSQVSFTLDVEEGYLEMNLFP